MKQKLQELHAAAKKLAADIRDLPESGKYIRLGVAISAAHCIADNLRCEIEAITADEKAAEEKGRKGEKEKGA